MAPLNTFAFLGSLGWPELIILAILGVLIFGRRLPEVGKSIGKGIVEFKKGLAGIDDDLEKASKPEVDPNRIESQASATVEPKSSDHVATESGGDATSRGAS